MVISKERYECKFLKLIIKLTMRINKQFVKIFGKLSLLTKRITNFYE